MNNPEINSLANMFLEMKKKLSDVITYFDALKNKYMALYEINCYLNDIIKKHDTKIICAQFGGVVFDCVLADYLDRDLEQIQYEYELMVFEYHDISKKIETLLEKCDDLYEQNCMIKSRLIKNKLLSDTEFEKFSSNVYVKYDLDTTPKETSPVRFAVRPGKQVIAIKRYTRKFGPTTDHDILKIIKRNYPNLRIFYSEENTSVNLQEILDIQHGGTKSDLIKTHLIVFIDGFVDFSEKSNLDNLAKILFRDTDDVEYIGNYVESIEGKTLTEILDSFNVLEEKEDKLLFPVGISGEEKSEDPVAETHDKYGKIVRTSVPKLSTSAVIDCSGEYYLFRYSGALTNGIFHKFHTACNSNKYIFANERDNKIILTYGEHDTRYIIVPKDVIGNLVEGHALNDKILKLYDISYFYIRPFEFNRDFDVAGSEFPIASEYISDESEIFVMLEGDRGLADHENVIMSYGRIPPKKSVDDESGELEGGDRVGDSFVNFVNKGGGNGENDGKSRYKGKGDRSGMGKGKDAGRDKSDDGGRDKKKTRVGSGWKPSANKALSVYKCNPLYPYNNHNTIMMCNKSNLFFKIIYPEILVHLKNANHKHYSATLKKFQYITNYSTPNWNSFQIYLESITNTFERTYDENNKLQTAFSYIDIKYTPEWLKNGLAHTKTIDAISIIHRLNKIRLIFEGKYTKELAESRGGESNIVHTILDDSKISIRYRFKSTEGLLLKQMKILPKSARVYVKKATGGGTPDQMYYDKYIEYKKKYLSLKNQSSGVY